MGPGPPAEEQQGRDPGAPSGCVPGPGVLSGENLPDTPLLVPRHPPCGAVGQTRFSALNPNNQTAAAEPGDRQALWLCFPQPRRPAHTASLVSPQAGEQGGQAACAVASLSLLPGRGPPSGLWGEGLEQPGPASLRDRLLSPAGPTGGHSHLWNWLLEKGLVGARGVGGALPLGQALPGVASGAFTPEPGAREGPGRAKPRPPRGRSPPLPGVSVSLFIGGVNYHVQFFSFQIILYLFKKSLLKYKI